MPQKKIQLRWFELFWQRNFEEAKVLDMLIHLAANKPRGIVVFEARSFGGDIHYLLGTDERFMGKTYHTVRSHGEIQLKELSSELRVPVQEARLLQVKHTQARLKSEATAPAIAAALSVLTATPKDQQAVVQVVLGDSFVISPTPPKNQPMWAPLLPGPEEPDLWNTLKGREYITGFDVQIRLGLSDGSPNRMNELYCAFRMLESVGCRMKLQPCALATLNEATLSGKSRSHLSVNELTAFLLLPYGETAMPGTEPAHPKLNSPPNWYRPSKAKLRSFATSLDKVNPQPLSISPRDSLEHCVLLGPTGSGKSTAMLSLILSDIRRGASVLVIDPKADLVTDILVRMPSGHRDRLVILDPSSPCPVGFNPLALPGDDAIIVDAILAVFKEVFKENWGIRTQDVLSAALLTLRKVDGANLLWLPAFLTDKDFRRDILKRIGDDIVLKPYWEQFEAMKDTERKQEIAPTLNKIRQFLYHEKLRWMLGQSKPKFQLTDLFFERKIVLVPLNKGLIGSECARLLGSLIVGLTWTLALSRAKIPPEKRHIISMYIDELQDYVALPTDFSDALAQARGLGVGITMAHQFRAQLSPELRAGVDANARNKIAFTLSGSDAKDMAAMAPELTAEDFMSLERYQIYTNFMVDGKATGWVLGQTNPPEPMNTLPVFAEILNMERYGTPIEEIQKEYKNRVQSSSPNEPLLPDITSLGRRKADDASIISS